MNEEEKEAIKTTKAILREWQKIVDIEDPEERDIEMSCYIEEMPFFEMKTLLKIIKKQKKEIKRLKNAEEYAKIGKETLLNTIHKLKKENQELKKRINKAVGIMDHLDSLDAEQFYEVDQVLKEAENHIPRID